MDIFPCESEAAGRCKVNSSTTDYISTDFYDSVYSGNTFCPSFYYGRLLKDDRPSELCRSQPPLYSHNRVGKGGGRRGDEQGKICQDSFGMLTFGKSTGAYKVKVQNCR
jgi:hypothetical protein